MIWAFEKNSLENLSTMVYNVYMKKKKPSSTSLHLRLPAKLKRDAERIFHASGLDMSTAIRLFFVSTVSKNAVPLKFQTQDGYPPDFVDELKRLAADKENIVGPFDSAEEAIAHLNAL